MGVGVGVGRQGKEPIFSILGLHLKRGPGLSEYQVGTVSVSGEKCRIWGLTRDLLSPNLHFSEAPGDSRPGNQWKSSAPGNFPANSWQFSVRAEHVGPEPES